MESEAAADAAKKKRNRHRKKRPQEEGAELPGAAEEPEEAVEPAKTAEISTAAASPLREANQAPKRLAPAKRQREQAPVEREKEKKEESALSDEAAPDRAQAEEYVFGREAPTEIITDYKALKLNPYIVAALEQEFKFTELTPIQSHSIPAALAGRDLLAEAKSEPELDPLRPPLQWHTSVRGLLQHQSFYA